MSLLEALQNPGAMTQQHWMVIGILALLVIGIGFFCWRTWLVIKEAGRSTYKPDIGLHKLDRAGRPPGADDKPPE